MTGVQTCALPISAPVLTLSTTQDDGGTLPEIVSSLTGGTALLEAAGSRLTELPVPQ